MEKDEGRRMTGEAEKTWEVELKYHLDDLNALKSRLEELDFEFVTEEVHEDIYLRHPCRDFKQTGEAFRIRQTGACAYATYKGPRQPGEVKTREEIEPLIQPNEFPQWQLIFERLGFRPVRSVRKSRRVYASQRDEYRFVTVAVDMVEDLGQFVEVEIIVTDEPDLESAKSLIADLSRRLGLERLEPRSYLTQILALNGR